MAIYADIDKFTRNLKTNEYGETTMTKIAIALRNSRVDVVSKSEVEQLITLNSQLEAMLFDTRKEIDILKSTITCKETEAYNEGYADAKADILEKLQADIARDEILAEYGDELFEGRIAGFKAVMNYILSEGEK